MQLYGHDEAIKCAEANKTPRYRRLETLERWVEGTQYDGRPSWWDDNVPKWERAPCLVYPVVEIAIASFEDLLFGEGRFPTFSTKPDESLDEEEHDLGLDDSVAVDRFIAKHHERSQFRTHCRDALSDAMGCGTAVGLHGVRNGKPFADTLPAKWCTPELGAEREVLSLEIRYPYLEEYRRPDGTWAMRAKLYRRVVDGLRDITFLPADARPDGLDPDWREDRSKSFQHGLGFCPTIWYPFQRGSAPVSQIDGRAIHAQLLDEIQAHDIARSQWHNTALLSEPQICEFGVPPNYNPTDTGRAPAVPASVHGGMLAGIGDGTAGNASNPVTGRYVMGPERGPARKKGPGWVWQYTDAAARVDAITIGADALKAQHDNCSDLRTKLQEALGVVFLDPDNIKFAATTSGKALEAIKQKQLDRCDKYRDDLRDNLLLPSVSMQLRIARAVGRGMAVAGAMKALPILQRFGQ